MKTEFVPKATTVVASCCVIFVAVALSDRLLTMRTLVSTGYLDALVNTNCPLYCVLCFLGFSADVNLRSRSLYAIARPSVVCLSVVCLSVCNVGAPYSAGCNFRQFFSPYDSPETPLFWCQKSLVGDAPFPLKFAIKVTHPFQTAQFRPISAHSASTVIASEKKFNEHL